MQQLYVEQLQPGMPVGQDIYNEQRQVLLTRGTPLTDGYIEGLRTRSFPAIWVMDGIADDLAPPDILSPRLRATTSMHLESLFLMAQDLVAQSDITDPQSAIEFAAMAKAQLAEIYDDAAIIVEGVARSSILSGVLTIKSHDYYTYEHSVEVAIASAILGQRVGVEGAELEALAVGSLLHDLGKVIVPREILNKPDELTAEEFDVIKKHPEAGFLLARKALSEGAIVPRNIIRQHHERQDGKGYPQGLRGTNRFDLEERRPFGQSNIMAAAEITAVADVYSALASDHRYRVRMKSLDTIAVLKEMAGSHLNRDLVSAFLSMLPSYPIGCKVVVTSSKLRGHRGVVSRINARYVSRPTVRILFDPQGRGIAPFEVDTSREKDISLAPASYGDLV